jgi:hypothetical protein
MIVASSSGGAARVNDPLFPVRVARQTPSSRGA